MSEEQKAEERRPEPGRLSRVLVCDDSSTMRALMQSLLGARYTLRWF